MFSFPKKHGELVQMQKQIDSQCQQIDEAYDALRKRANVFQPYGLVLRRQRRGIDVHLRWRVLVGQSPYVSLHDQSTKPHVKLKEEILKKLPPQQLELLFEIEVERAQLEMQRLVCSRYRQKLVLMREQMKNVRELRQRVLGNTEQIFSTN